MQIAAGPTPTDSQKAQAQLDKLYQKAQAVESDEEVEGMSGAQARVNEDDW